MLVARSRYDERAEKNGVVHGPAENAASINAIPSIATKVRRETVDSHADREDVGICIQGDVDTPSESDRVKPAIGAGDFNVEQTHAGGKAWIFRAARGDQPGAMCPMPAGHTGWLRAGGVCRRYIETRVGGIDARIQNSHRDTVSGRAAVPWNCRAGASGLECRNLTERVASGHQTFSPLDERDSWTEDACADLMDGVVGGLAM
ncbi:MAG TPA: hypothetical protein VJ885_00245 [Thermoanaerobaculia bacterium]|nr:hypothetical protein [Thermoanaerobaculia bacterium]